MNEKVLTFPCTLADVEAAGVQLESEYNPRDLMVEAGDYEFAFFGDANGNSIAFELSNPEDKAKKLEECIVTGVSVDDYSVGNGGLTIIFPGGIQIGTEKAAVIEKYGETEEVYEGEHSHSYTWYDPEYYYKYCEIDFDPESGKVMSMDLTCTEF